MKKERRKNRTVTGVIWIWIWFSQSTKAKTPFPFSSLNLRKPVQLAFRLFSLSTGLGRRNARRPASQKHRAIDIPPPYCKDGKRCGMIEGRKGEEEEELSSFRAEWGGSGVCM